MRPNRVHALPGTILFAVAAAVVMALGQALVLGLVAAVRGIQGAPVDAASMATWASSHPLLVTGGSWLLLLPLVRLLGGALSASSGEDFGIVPGGRRPVALGFALGAALLLLPAGIGALLGAYAHPTSEVATGLAALPAILVTLPLLAVLAFGEELLFRGFLMRYWRGMGPRGVLLMTSLAFALVHSANPSASVLGGVGVLLAGLTLGVARMASGGLWLPWGVHLGWNAATALALGLPVSGFELPALLRWAPRDSEWARGLLGGGFGPEEGLAYHAAWVLGLVVVLAVGPAFQDGPPSSRGEGASSERSAGSSSPR